MSFMDKLKAMFSGGSDSHDHSHDDHSHEGHDHDHDHDHSADAAADLPATPAAPLDPLGTSMPEASPVPTSIPPASGSDDENA
jgi:ABC-type Zn2+ transport system substrate-binding protein/surface adhesin